MCCSLEHPSDEEVDADLDDSDLDEALDDVRSAGVAAASAMATTDAGLGPNWSFSIVGRLTGGRLCLCIVGRRTVSVGRVLSVSLRRTGWPLQFTMFSRMALRQLEPLESLLRAQPVRSESARDGGGHSA